MLYRQSFIFIICIVLFVLFLVPLSVFANVPDQSHSSLSVSSAVPADGQTTAIITITLHDKSGNPVVGHSVKLEDSSNSGATITTIKDATDENGHALFSIRSTKTQTDNLDVTDITSNIKFFNLGKITFTTAGCFDSPPGSAPQLISAIAKTPTQITLTWNAAANPVTHYLVSYGLVSGQYIYGNPNVGGQGITSYTVGSLSPGKKYYFVVQAINGCTPGNFSNEVSTTAGGIIINTPILVQKSLTDTSSTNNQNTTSPSSIPNKNAIKPINTLTPSQNIQPTIFIPTQTPAQDNSIIKLVIFISISILVLGSLGNILYWRHEKRIIELIKIERKKHQTFE